MANFFTDNKHLKFHLSHPLMKKIVELKERNFEDYETYDDAPKDFEDALDNFEKVLDIIGEISGDTIAENAEDVDATGAKVVDNHVEYAEGTKENIEKMCEGEADANRGKLQAAEKAAEEGISSARDYFFESAKDEARHAKMLKGLLDNYF